jgi:hypothetical protein
MNRAARVTLVAAWILGAVVAVAPDARARLRATDPDDVRYHLDIRSVVARGSNGRFRVHFGFYEPIPWRTEWPVVRVHVNSRGGPALDYEFSTSRRGPRHFRCELRIHRTDRLVYSRRSFSSGRRWLACEVPRRKLRPDGRIEWNAIAYVLGRHGTDRAPDDGAYPHA